MIKRVTNWLLERGIEYKVVGVDEMKKSRKEVLRFFAVTIIASWLCWVPLLLRNAGVNLNFPYSLLNKVGDFMPSVVAILITAFMLGRAEMLKLLKSMINIRIGIRWYMYIFFIMPGVLSAAYLFSYIAVGLKFESILAPMIFPRLWPVFLLLVYFITIQGPLGEELGWRGYALPRLFKIMNPLKSSIILGLVWSVWHFPKFYIEGTTQYSIMLSYGIIIALLGYTLYTVLVTFMMTMLFIKTGRSVFAAILFHAVANFSHGLITILTKPVGGIFILSVMLIVTVIIVTLNKKDFLI